MKMHHLTKEQVEEILQKVREVIGAGTFDQELMEGIFKLSGVDGPKFLDCKSNDIQKDKVNFELDPEKGIRFFDPFNFFTCGIYKDVDGWSVWTTDNLKEPWSY